MIDLCAILLQTPAAPQSNSDAIAAISAMAPYLVPAMGMGFFQYLLSRRKAVRDQMIEDREFNKDYIGKLLADRQGQIDRLQAENEALEAKCDQCERDRESLRISLTRVESQLESARVALAAIHRQYGDQISLTHFIDPSQLPPAP